MFAGASLSSGQHPSPSPLPAQIFTCRQESGKRVAWLSALKHCGIVVVQAFIARRSRWLSFCAQTDLRGHQLEVP
eukprot:12478175-Alexandrium_andersonii.AAC.1